MKYCPRCGALMTDETMTCPKCGSAQFSNTQPGHDQSQQGFQELQNGGWLGNDRTNEFDPADAANNKVIAALSYLGILFFLPLAVNPNSPYCRFHANQGLLVLITSIALGIASSIIGSLSSIPFIGFVFSIVTGLLGTASGFITFCLLMYGLINTLSGRSRELPIIGKISIIK